MYCKSTNSKVEIDLRRFPRKNKGPQKQRRKNAPATVLWSSNTWNCPRPLLPSGTKVCSTTFCLLAACLIAASNTRHAKDKRGSGRFR
jgi:hypothetical protein